MDCNQAELAMMAHMEKTIQPAQAQDLAQHILKCQDCQEYYIGFDMAMDVLNDTELSAAPPDFTQAVMAQVHKLPAHTKPEPVVISVSLRILWGLSAIALGIGLLFAFNPEWLASFAVMDGILNGVGAIAQYVTGLVENLAPGYRSASGLTALNASVLFVAVIGVLLVVLQRSEKSHNS